MSENINRTHISRITLGRVFNLGNYENCRYEITVSLKEGEDAAELLAKLEEGIENLRAGKDFDKHDLRRAENLLQKPAAELSEWDLTRLPEAKKTVAEYQALKEREAAARQLLAGFGGGSEVETDAKNNWDDDDGDGDGDDDDEDE